MRQAIIESGLEDVLEMEQKYAVEYMHSFKDKIESLSDESVSISVNSEDPLPAAADEVNCDSVQEGTTAV